MDQSDPMELWKKVQKTDPEFAKDVRIGARHYTAINAQYQLRKATELWGPFGQAWGLREMTFGYMTQPSEHGPEVVEEWLEAEFYYPGGSFPISTDIKYRSGDDCRKKLRTDAITKALSSLGFNADVFMGMWDDNKYVHAQIAAKEREKANAAYDAVVAAGRSLINRVNDARSATACVNCINANEIDGLPHVGDSQYALKKEMAAKAERLNLTYDKEKKRFIDPPSKEKEPE